MQVSKVNTSPHLNATRLAAALKKTTGYVSAMRSAGYAFLFGALTTEEHARAWIEQTGFTSTAYFKAAREGKRAVAAGN